ncbi:MAG: host-nuclease inhibitor Gam family protein [Eubacterium sp.]|nr:host-nuclease inhibitor Gam family protein [Eubacterium sp.]
MARKRMGEPELKSWEEVDGTLKQIREAEIELSALSVSAEKRILDIKQRTEAAAQPYKDQIKRLELQIKEFTTLNKSELKGKTREMAFGRVGFRMSTKLVLPKAVETVITQLRKNGMGDCIVTKESVNKEILKTYDENTIIGVGASLKKEDTFWYETKQEKIAEPG